MIDVKALDAAVNALSPEGKKQIEKLLEIFEGYKDEVEKLSEISEGFEQLAANLTKENEKLRAKLQDRE